MAVESESFTELADEFALVAETAAEAGVPADALPRVRRGWVNVPAGGHVSGVFWGDGPPELVFLHDTGGSARRWDAVALAAGRPAVAVDLPGHGRSDWRRDRRYEPAKLAPAVAEAIRSFAPRVVLVVGAGLGADTALALHRRHPPLVPALALAGTLPGPLSGRAGERSDPERFASRADALAALAGRRPESSRPALRREVLYELLQEQDGSWTWRHHWGNQPAAPGHGVAGGPADAALWDELGRLGPAAAVIRGDQAGPLTEADLARLAERAPGAAVVTVPGAGADITARPAALAAALVRLVAQPPRPAANDRTGGTAMTQVTEPSTTQALSTRRVRTELNHRRVRVFFGGEAVADSSRTLYLFETGHLPVYYFPRGDVRFDLLEPTSHHTHCPYKGDASYYTVVAGGRRYENAVWAYPDPIDSVPELKDYVAFYWNQADAWYEEDDEVYKHPRDPYHRVDVLNSSRHVQVLVGGVLVAESRRPRLLFETGLPVRYYLPKLDVRLDLLEPSATRSRCPYKGEAVYWSVQAGGEVLQDMVWSYPSPIPEAPKIENLLAFYNEKADLVVDGVPQERPVTKWS